MKLRAKIILTAASLALSCALLAGCGSSSGSTASSAASSEPASTVLSQASSIPLGEEVPLTLYGGGGGGYAIIPECDDVDLDDEFCFYGVGGVEIGLGESASLFVEAQYRFLEVDGAETDDDVEIDFGEEDIEFTGLGVNAGLLFRF